MTEPDLTQEYDDSDPRRLSDEARDELARTTGRTRAELDAEIERIGWENYDQRDPMDIPPGALTRLDANDDPIPLDAYGNPKNARPV